MVKKLPQKKERRPPRPYVVVGFGKKQGGGGVSDPPNGRLNWRAPREGEKVEKGKEGLEVFEGYIRGVLLRWCWGWAWVCE